MQGHSNALFRTIASHIGTSYRLLERIIHTSVLFEVERIKVCKNNAPIHEPYHPSHLGTDHIGFWAIVCLS